MCLRTELIFPQLMAAMRKGVPGATVSYLQKTDDYESSQEDIRNELMRMKAENLVHGRQGGRWALTELGQNAALNSAVAIPEKTAAPADQKPEAPAKPAQTEAAPVTKAEPVPEAGNANQGLHDALDATRNFADTLCALEPQTTPDTRQAIRHLGRFLDESIAAELDKVLADADQLASIRCQAQAVFRTR